jgi:hypothetical protein
LAQPGIDVSRNNDQVVWELVEESREVHGKLAARVGVLNALGSESMPLLRKGCGSTRSGDG